MIIKPTMLPKLNLNAAPERIAFLNLLIGGTAGHCLPHFCANSKQDGDQFPVVNVQVDTDPSAFTGSLCDVPLYLPVNGDIVSVIRGNAALFPAHVGKILISQSHMLAAGDIRNGMRTTRSLSQIVWSYYEEAIAEALRQACDRLVKLGVTAIVPVIGSSTGGGTGSAFSVMMLDALSDRRFMASMLLGYPTKLLLPPLMFAVEPVAYAREKDGMQRKKILANAYAYRLETDELIKRGARCQYIFHLGFANDTGTCIRTGDQMGQVLGNSMYTIERNYLELKRDWVDGPDDAAATDYARVTNSLSREVLSGRNGASSVNLS